MNDTKKDPNVTAPTEQAWNLFAPIPSTQARAIQAGLRSGCPVSGMGPHMVYVSRHEDARGYGASVLRF